VNSPLHILFEDADCLAVVKPAGQFTQGTWAPPGESTLEQSVRRHLDPDRPESTYLGIVHRLDRPTSGVLIWAKTAKAARRLSTQFETRRVVKEYWALVECPGVVEPGDPIGAPAGEDASVPPSLVETWTDWLTRTARTGLAQVVESQTPGSRRAVTRVKSDIARTLPAGVAWLRLWPETGRTHQLRAQSAARGWPILGDRDYGAKSSFGPPHAIALHARSLRVTHPILQTPLILLAPLPPAWEARGIDETAIEGGGKTDPGLTPG
jgi:23S rRNA pseudouridine1911/1915/1917 synthase